MTQLDLRALRTRRTLSLVTRLADPEMARIHATLAHAVHVDGRSDVEALFGQLLAQPDEDRVMRTLDLVGHTTPDHALLQLGDWTIDATRPSVTSFFRNLADNDVLPRLGIHAVRLLGCGTASTQLGRDTICALSDILGIEVHGTTSAVHAGHFTAEGFAPAWRFLLAGASDLRRDASDLQAPVIQVCGRTLEIDALPAEVLTEHAWQYRFVPPTVARELLSLVRRTDGAQMPGLLAQPSCELALPAAARGSYHRMQVVLDGAFVRTYPDGEHAPAVLYPVTDAAALRQLVDALPITSAVRPRD